MKDIKEKVYNMICKRFTIWFAKGLQYDFLCSKHEGGLNFFLVAIQPAWKSILFKFKFSCL
jgi:hypothetical protein